MGIIITARVISQSALLALGVRRRSRAHFPTFAIVGRANGAADSAEFCARQKCDVYLKTICAADNNTKENPDPSMYTYGRVILHFSLKLVTVSISVRFIKFYKT